MGQRTQTQCRRRGDQHGQHRADQGAPHERRRTPEKLPVEVTAQTAADQPLADLAAAIGQADVQVPADADGRTDQQRPEQPGVGLTQALPDPGRQRASGKQHRQPAPIDAASVGNRRTVAQQILEGCRHAEHHDQHPQTLPRRHTAEYRTIAGAEVDHLPGTAGHAGKERRGAIFSGTAHQPHADHGGQAGDQRTKENQTEMTQHLLHHHRGEVQAYADADDPLAALAAARDFRELPRCQAAHEDDRQQRADHPRQRPADLAGEITAQQADQRGSPPEFEGGPIRHRRQRVAPLSVYARCAQSAPAA
ncbi:hypothetical protein D3C71_1043750 [compost metagenome]